MPVIMQDDVDNLLGYDRLKSPELNKGTAFTVTERDQYKLHGLLPARVSTFEAQELRALENLRRKACVYLGSVMALPAARECGTATSTYCVSENNQTAAVLAPEDFCFHMMHGAVLEGSVDRAFLPGKW